MEIKTIIIPDVHGRAFWKEAVKNNEDKDIIFLGDYHDPYTNENITQKESIDNFKEILSFYESHKNNVTLLLGNHDLGYIDRSICSCRRDYVAVPFLNETFTKRKEEFNLCTERIIGGKRFVFSHSGIVKDWLQMLVDSEQYFFCDICNEKGEIDLCRKEIIGKINDLFHCDGDKFDNLLDFLAFVSFWRGGIDACGSMVWCDFRELMEQPNVFGQDTIQVVGHTQCMSPFLLNDYWLLDTRNTGYFIDDEGELHSFKEPNKKIKLINN